VPREAEIEPEIGQIVSRRDREELRARAAFESPGGEGGVERVERRAIGGIGERPPFGADVDEVIGRIGAIAGRARQLYLVPQQVRDGTCAAPGQEGGCGGARPIEPRAQHRLDRAAPRGQTPPPGRGLGGGVAPPMRLPDAEQGG